jgi:hypothetical protein
MLYVLLGLVALVAFLIAGRVFTSASPQVLARQLRILGGVATLAIALVFVFRGAAGYAAPLAALGFWLLFGGGGAGWGGYGTQPSVGQASRIKTAFLEVELEHDSGRIRGRVLRGEFAGRDLEDLSPMQMARLWQDCRFADPQSAQVLEAYLDRAHPSWREDMARADGGDGRRAAGEMSRAQALDILGLSEGAGDDEVRRAHRDLMMKMHPDRGGSTFLAAKINQAKDVLLGRD